MFAVLVSFAADDSVSVAELRAVAGRAAVAKATSFFNSEAALNFDDFLQIYKANPGPIDWLHFMNQPDLEAYIAQHLSPSTDNDDEESRQTDTSSLAAEVGDPQFSLTDADDESTAPSKEDETSDEFISIPLSEDGSQLKISLQALQSFSLFHSIPASLEELHHIFQHYASEEGSLTRDEFVPVMQHLVSDHPMIPEMAGLLFSVFDRSRDGAIDLKEFVQGIFLLSGVSIAEKLEIAFKAVDTNGDGALQLQELTDFFFKFFALLISVSGTSTGLPSMVLDALLNRAAKWKAREFLDTADTDQNGSISFDEFVAAYESNPTLIPWLYLFDSPGIDFQSGGDSEQENHEPAAPTKPVADPIEELVYSDEDCILIPLSLDGATVLRIPAEDLVTFSLFRSIPTSVEELSAIFQTYASDSGHILLENFFPALKHLLKDHQEVHTMLLHELTSLLFNLLADNDAIDFDSFVRGIHVLSGPDKLLVAFYALDRDGDGVISPTELCQFFYSFFSLLVALSGASEELDPNVMDVLIGRAATYKAEQFFYVADTNGDLMISAEEFEAAYMKHPALISWLYLFDAPSLALVEPPSKSVGVEEQNAAVEPEVQVESSTEFVEQAQNFEELVHANENCILIPLSPDGGSVLRIPVADLSTLRLFRSVPTKLSKLTAIFQAYSSDDGLITREEFFPVMQHLLKDHTESQELVLEALTSNLFNLFDTNDTGTVDMEAFIRGIYMLSAANIQDKLRVAFQAVDRNGDGTLSPPELAQFFYAFFTLLVALSGAADEMPPSVLDVLLGRAATYKAEQFFFVADSTRDFKITFEEYLAAYAKNPALVPWLTLFDFDDNLSDVCSSVSNVSNISDKKESRGDPLEKLVQSDAQCIVIPLSADGESALRIPIESLSTFNLFRSLPSQLEELFEIFRHYASEEGVLTREEFFPAMQHLLKGHDLSCAPILQDLVDSLFNVFDTRRDGCVDLNAFVRGIYLLGGADIEDKLRIAFEAVDKSGDGTLSPAELAEFFYSFFALLVSLSGTSVGLPSAVLDVLLGRAATYKAEQFFAVADTNRDLAISYDEYIAAYQRDPTLVSWLYLFDASANVPDASVSAVVSDTGSVASAPPAPSAPTADERWFESNDYVAVDPDWIEPREDLSEYEMQAVEEHKHEEDKHLQESTDSQQSQHAIKRIFISANGSFIDIEMNDILHLSHFRQLLDSQTRASMERLFAAHADEDQCLTRKAFGRTMAGMFNDTDKSSSTALIELIAGLFDMFDSNNDGVVSLSEFFSGLALLSNTSIHDRLQLAFRAMDQDGDSWLDPDEIWHFFHVFFKLALSKSSLAAELHPAVLEGLVHQATTWKANEFMELADSDGDGRICYDEFCGVFAYNPALLAYFDFFLLSHDHYQEDAAEVLQVGGDIEIPVSQTWFTNIGFLRDSMAGLSVPQMLDYFHAVSLNGSIDLNGFRTCMEELAPGIMASSVGPHFSTLFHLLDVDQSGRIDVSEFMAGLSGILFPSLVDFLKVGFQIMDTDRNGTLSRSEINRYFQSVLGLLVALSDLGLQPVERCRTLVNRAADARSRQFLHFFDSDHDGEIDLDEFVMGVTSHPDLAPFLFGFMLEFSEAPVPPPVPAEQEYTDTKSGQDINFNHFVGPNRDAFTALRVALSSVGANELILQQFHYHADSQQLLNAGQYEACLRALFPSVDHAAPVLALVNLFPSFSSNGFLDADAFCSVLTWFANGNHQERVKMAFHVPE